jgi:nitrite reductase/ring-hydroxylating ferredoxin subunit
MHRTHISVNKKYEAVFFKKSVSLNKGTDFFVFSVPYMGNCIHGDMKIEGFEQIAKLDEAVPERSKRIIVEGREIVFFRTGAEIFAVENLCPHQHYSVFHQSILNEYTITCPMHGWGFDVRTGKNITGNGQLKVFEIRLEGNDV